MPTKATPIVGGSRVMLAGDIIWLGVTVFAFAAIMGIVCWPLSAELSPGFLAGAATASATASLIPETSATATLVAPSSASSVNRIPLPGGSVTMAGEVADGSSSVAPTTPIAAPTGARLSLREPVAERLPKAAPARSSLAPAVAHQSDPHRPRQPRQPTRPPPLGAGGELVPW